MAFEDPSEEEKRKKKIRKRFISSNDHQLYKRDDKKGSNSEVNRRLKKSGLRKSEKVYKRSKKPGSPIRPADLEKSTDEVKSPTIGVPSWAKNVKDLPIEEVDIVPGTDSICKNCPFFKGESFFDRECIVKRHTKLVRTITGGVGETVCNSRPKMGDLNNATVLQRIAYLAYLADLDED